MRCSARKSRTSALPKVRHVERLANSDQRSITSYRSALVWQRVLTQRGLLVKVAEGLGKVQTSLEVQTLIETNGADTLVACRSMDNDGQQVMLKPYMSGRCSCRPFRVQHVTLHFSRFFFMLVAGKSYMLNVVCYAIFFNEQIPTRWNMIAV